MKTTHEPRLRLHTLQEAAATLKLCTRTVRRLIDRGELKALRIGRSIPINHDELELYLVRAGQ